MLIALYLVHMSCRRYDKQEASVVVSHRRTPRESIGQRNSIFIQVAPIALGQVSYSLQVEVSVLYLPPPCSLVLAPAIHLMYYNTLFYTHNVTNAMACIVILVRYFLRVLSHAVDNRLARHAPGTHKTAVQQLVYKITYCLYRAR